MAYMIRNANSSLYVISDLIEVAQIKTRAKLVISKCKQRLVLFLFRFLPAPDVQRTFSEEQRSRGTGLNSKGLWVMSAPYLHMACIHLCHAILRRTQGKFSFENCAVPYSVYFSFAVSTRTSKENMFNRVYFFQDSWVHNAQSRCATNVNTELVSSPT